MTDPISNDPSKFANSLAEAVRNNPFSSALIGMGVVWLFAGGARRFSPSFNAVGETLRPSGGVSPAIGSSIDSVSEVGDHVTHAARAAAGRVSDYNDSVTELAASAWDNTRENLSQIFTEQPLALGLVGLAMGAGIAASIPSSELEKSYLGDASHQVGDQVATFAAAQVENVRGTASKVIDAVKEEARAQQLTPGDLRNSLSDLKTKAGRVVAAAVNANSERTEPSDEVNSR